MTSLDQLPNEILEQVLLHLPTKDLLFAQAVSRRWRAMIQLSPRIQEALFLKPVKSFRPITDPAVRALLEAGKISQAATAMAINNSPPGTPKWMLDLGWSAVDSYFAAAMPSSSRTTPAAKTIKNSLLEARFEGFLPISCMQADSLTHATVMMVQPYEDGDDGETEAPIKPLPGCFLYPEASWRRMFITQSPCASGSFECTLDLEKPLKTSHVVKFEGIRLGDLITDDTLAAVGLLPAASG